jgi:hypothetical protein
MPRRPLSLVLAALVSGLSAFPLQAQDLPKGALCTLADIQQCDSQGCERVLAEEIDVPRFIHLDMAKKTLQGVGPRARDRVSPIAMINQQGGLVFAQGIDDQAKGEKTAYGWALVMDAKEGSMRLSVTGDVVTFVANGDCLIDP